MKKRGEQIMEAIITVIIVLLVCIVIWYISTSNGIKRSQLKVEEAESGIDVALTKRYDVLTKMLDVVKGYQAHEKTVLTELVKLRSGMTMAEKNAANQKMEQLTKDINILAENYPELKSSNNFMELQKTIADVEEHLQAARRLYSFFSSARICPCSISIRVPAGKFARIVSTYSVTFVTSSVSLSSTIGQTT